MEYSYSTEILQAPLWVFHDSLKWWLRVFGGVDDHVLVRGLLNVQVKMHVKALANHELQYRIIMSD